MQDLSLAVVFAATILGLYLRPFGARDWQIAAIGAAAAWLVGPLGLRAGLDAVADSANIVAFFLGLMLIAAGADAAGLYARAAALLRVRHSTQAKVVTVLLSGTLITAVLSNDATPLVLTPAIFAAGAAGSPGTRRTALAATFTADGASLLLPVSNPVNLLFFERFEMGFDTYLSTITPAAAAGIAVMSAVVWWQSRRLTPDAAPGTVPVSIAAPDSRPAVVVVGALAVAYVVAGLAGTPLGAVTLAGGAAMLVAARLGGSVDPGRVRRHIAPGVLLFVAALLLLVESVSAAGLLDPLADALTGLDERPALVTIVGAASIAAVLSNLMNNWPAALLIAATIGTSAGPHEELVAGALIGSAIGANFTMLGSLSTVFWLNLARQSGASFGAGEYARAAFLPTAGGILAACLVAAALV